MITAGRLKFKDIPDDFEWLENKLFCGGCTFLSPKEADQSSKKEDHRCLFWNNKKVLHKGHHPRLPPLDICEGDGGPNA